MVEIFLLGNKLHEFVVQAFYCRELLKIKLVKRLFRRFVEQDFCLMLGKEILRVTGFPVCRINFTSLREVYDLRFKLRYFLNTCFCTLKATPHKTKGLEKS